MGIDTKAIIDGKKVSKLDVLRFLKERFSASFIGNDFKPYFEAHTSFWIRIDGKNRPRSIFTYTYAHKEAFSTDYPSISSEIDIPVVLILEQDDEAIEIMESILQQFGGYLIQNDSNSKIEYVPSQNKESGSISEIQSLRVFCSSFQEDQTIFNAILSNKEFLIQILKNIE